jgi:hypothetical protein
MSVVSGFEPDLDAADADRGVYPDCGLIESAEAPGARRLESHFHPLDAGGAVP